MDELTLLRNFHRDTPGPSPAETEAARARLLALIDDPHCAAARAGAPRRRPAVLGHLSRSRLWAPVSAAAAVTAVAVTAAVIAVPGSRAAPGSTGSPPTAASALNEAASAAARQSAGHGRYFFVQSESVSSTGQPQGVPGRCHPGMFGRASFLPVQDQMLPARWDLCRGTRRCRYKGDTVAGERRGGPASPGDRDGNLSRLPE